MILKPWLRCSVDLNWKEKMRISQTRRPKIYQMKTGQQTMIGPRQSAINRNLNFVRKIFLSFGCRIFSPICFQMKNDRPAAELRFHRAEKQV